MRGVYIEEDAHMISAAQGIEKDDIRL